jgi:hypothetical protein
LKVKTFNLTTTFMKSRKFIVAAVAAFAVVSNFSFCASEQEKNKFSWLSFARNNKATVVEGAVAGGCTGFTLSRWFPRYTALFSTAGAFGGIAWNLKKKKEDDDYLCGYREGLKEGVEKGVTKGMFAMANFFGPLGRLSQDEGLSVGMNKLFVKRNEETHFRTTAALLKAVSESIESLSSVDEILGETRSHLDMLFEYIQNVNDDGCP